jgi:site-specific DNA-cytosine methylase
MILTPRQVEVRHFHLFCGLGGGAKGFNRGTARVGHAVARFRCVGGIDVDAAAIRDFDKMAGVKGTVLDLFSREQYLAFHGSEPPTWWREATPADIRRAAGGERPHIGFGSAPCKGFSGLLSESKSKSDKYHALNQLALRGLRLALEAWKDDPLDFWLWENVPRIATRGRAVLDQMVGLLADYGYAVSETTHDCGELGGLAQSRKRFLLVARHREKVPPFLYEPPKRRVRGVGEVIGKLPVPGPDVTLPMHRLPMLQWQTWVRLAFVEAGSDWRSLNRLNVADGVLRDYALVPSREWNNGVLGVKDWTGAAGVVTGNSRPGSGAHSVADPRIDAHVKSVQHGVLPWEGRPAPVVTGKMFVGGGPHSVADPRLFDDNKWTEGRRGLGVLPWERTAGAVTSQGGPMQGTYSVADPRPDWNTDYAALGVNTWEGNTGAIIGVRAPGQGRFSVADPRLEGKPRFNNVFRIVPFDGVAPAVAGSGGPGGGLAVADPRPGYTEATHTNILKVTPFDGNIGAITAADHVTGGAQCVADPRVDGRNGMHGVLAWQETVGVVAGESLPSNGKFAVADPRPPQGERNGKGKYKVSELEGPAGTVIGASTTGNGAFAVADPRPVALRDGKDVYKTQGEYGVVPWGGSAAAVTAQGQHDNGRWTVADPREHAGDALVQLPAPTDRLIAVIQALDGTYHRPFTSLELARVVRVASASRVEGSGRASGAPGLSLGLFDQLSIVDSAGSDGCTCVEVAVSSYGDHRRAGTVGRGLQRLRARGLVRPEWFGLEAINASRAAEAPAGYHVALQVRVVLENGSAVRYAWATPMALHRAYAKAPRWAREDMAAAKIPGRSKIRLLLVEAKLVLGDYEAIEGVARG